MEWFYNVLQFLALLLVYKLLEEFCVFAKSLLLFSARFFDKYLKLDDLRKGN